MTKIQEVIKPLVKEKNKLETRIVAFLDIMGYKNLINENESALTILKIENVITKARNLFSGGNKNDYFTISLFSDCFCISCKDDTPIFFYLINALSLLQRSFFAELLPLRGGVAIGTHYESKNIIFGKGLLKAYELEKKKAIYPRVVLHEDLIPKYTSGFSSGILKSPDNLYFIDYLHGVSSDENEIYENIIIQKEALVKHVKNNFTNPKILEKYRWIAYYHNAKCRELYSEKTENQDLNLSKFINAYIEIENVFPTFKRND